MNIDDIKEYDKEDCNKEWFVAIDPGKVNFAFIVEEIDKDMLKDIICPIKKDRFIKNGKKDVSPTDKYTNFLEEFYHCGRTILCSNNDITRDLSKDEKDEKDEKVVNEPKKRRKKGEKKEERKGQKNQMKIDKNGKKGK